MNNNNNNKKRIFSFLNREKNFYNNVFSLAIPLVLQNLLSCALGLIDSYVNGRLGELSLAAVSVYGIPNTVVWSFSFGSQGGTSILVSQYNGKKDNKSINKVMGVGLIMSVLVSLIYALINIICPNQFYSLFSNEQEVIKLTSLYATPCSVANLLNTFDMIYLAVLRSIGYPQFGTVILGFSMVSNIILDFILAYGWFGAPALGLVGTAYATLIVRTIEFIAVILHMIFNKKFKVELKYVLNPGIDMFKRHFKNAGTVILNESIWGLGISAISNVMSHMPGSTAILSARSISSNVEWISSCFEMSLSASASVIIGNNVGAGTDKNTIKDIGKALITLSTLVGFVWGILLFIIAKTILPIYIYPAFNFSKEAAGICTMMTICGAILTPFKSFNNTVVTGVLRGGGDVKVSALIDTLPLWLAAVPYAYITGMILKLDINIVYLTFVVQYAIQTIFGLIRMSGTKWIKDITGTASYAEQKAFDDNVIF